MKRRHRLQRFVLPMAVAVNVFLTAALIFAAYAGYIDPEKIPFAGLAGLTFIFWWIATIALLIFDCFCFRRLAFIPAAGIIATIKPLLIFSPLHFSQPETPVDDPPEQSFKILSYNVLSCVDEASPDFNRTIHTILASDADAVFLAEYENLGSIGSFASEGQVDSLHQIYPYFIRGRMGNVLYSKRPIMHINLPSWHYYSGSHEAFRTTMSNGRGVTIFGVHMISYGMSDTDKAAYGDILSSHSEDALRNAKHLLLDKLYSAFQLRAKQAQFIREYVEQLPGENIVICGDFNDVPGCRAIHILEEAGMRNAYSELGLGPQKTFLDRRFPFRIDHVLYQGDFDAVSIRRGEIPSSDHLPLLTTFRWRNNKTD